MIPIGVADTNPMFAHLLFGEDCASVNACATGNAGPSKSPNTITLQESVERYRATYGCYPEVVQADKIYRNRDNLAYCKLRGIRLSGPKLRRPGKDAERDRELEKQDSRERNMIEGRNGMAKRRFGLDLIMAVLPETALTEAAFQILCINARIRLLLSHLLQFLFGHRHFPAFG